MGEKLCSQWFWAYHWYFRMSWVQKETRLKQDCWVVNLNVHSKWPPIKAYEYRWWPQLHYVVFCCGSLVGLALLFSFVLLLCSRTGSVDLAALATRISRATGTQVKVSLSWLCRHSLQDLLPCLELKHIYESFWWYGLRGDIADSLETSLCANRLWILNVDRLHPVPVKLSFFNYLGQGTLKSCSEMCDLVPAGQFAIGVD
jgi:hypothetical protein